MERYSSVLYSCWSARILRFECSTLLGWGGRTVTQGKHEVLHSVPGTCAGHGSHRAGTAEIGSPRGLLSAAEPAHKLHTSERPCVQRVRKMESEKCDAQDGSLASMNTHTCTHRLDRQTDR